MTFYAGSFETNPLACHKHELIKNLFDQFEIGSSSSHGSSEMNQTPSPSDSAASDLETVLKEKDSEINFLRETMEQNEQVIFKVRNNQVTLK